uniref:HDC02939 n=1 Tax=Drosophila melanogaster TaxID=7227 RepID=Q6IH98_DROME|nr:TPA_inf: HDC02939 [Drosophila melanogaster]
MTTSVMGSNLQTRHNVDHTFQRSLKFLQVLLESKKSFDAKKCARKTEMPRSRTHSKKKIEQKALVQKVIDGMEQDTKKGEKYMWVGGSKLIDVLSVRFEDPKVAAARCLHKNYDG